MMPIGPLMIEHRLIEKMILLIEANLKKFIKEDALDPAFIDTAVDFIRTYADRCHHGKEEDILFRDLAKKKIPAELKNIMDELIQEHKYARSITAKIVAAKEAYVKGDKNALKEAVANAEILVKFYPPHITKEDKRFFIPCMEYFTLEESNAMLAEMREFDRNLIHPATGKPPSKDGVGMRLHSSREDAVIEEASGFSRMSVTEKYAAVVERETKAAG